MQEVTMKRNAILLAMLSIMAIWLSGCILSSSPAGDVTVKLTTGESQKFTVVGQYNGPYSWYINDAPITGEASASYTYLAISADIGDNIIRVETTDKLSGALLSRQWSVTVIDDLPPIANAGPDQDVTFDGSTFVYLDGSSSLDPESKPLSYIWEIVSQPAGSSASLDNPGAMMPSFVPDKEGAYTIRLIVNDGKYNSIGDACTINVFNTFSPPLANAGTDVDVLLGDDTVLDGTGSIDYSGHGLTYKWAIDSGPAGSAATLDDATKSQPVFSPDLKGMYVISLVVNDTLNDSNTDWVVVTVYNNTPIARAGSDILVPSLGGTANIDGSASSDPDGTPLTFAWTLTSKPKGSLAALSGANTAYPSFTCDKKGAYLVALTVSDGDLSSSDMIMVTCSNQVPVAEAGADIVIAFLGTAQLNGSGSDPDGDPLSYSWSVASAPEGSTAVISNPNIYNPTFTPDIEGVYTLSLIVTDNDVPPISSAPDTMRVTTTNHAPVANAGSDININLFGTANLIGGGSDIDGDPIVGYAWTIINTPFGSTAAISNPAIQNPTFTPDLKGDYQLGLIVFDGTDWSPVVDTVMIHVFNNRPIAVITGPAQPTLYANRVVTLSGSTSYDPDGDSIKGYRWEIASKPDGSSTAITNQYTTTQTVTLDKHGDYVISLFVNDGVIESTAGTFTITTSTYHYLYSWDDGNTLYWADVDDGAGLSNNRSVSSPNSLLFDNQYGVFGLGHGGQTSEWRWNHSSYVISVSAWIWGDCHSAACGIGIYTSPNFDFRVNGATYADLGLPEQSWVQWQWALGYVISSVGFKEDCGNTVTADEVSVDNVDITVWN
jgi:hypothetical protein